MNFVMIYNYEVIEEHVSINGKIISEIIDVTRFYDV